MSCWVVPTVAAEYWGITLDVVWRRIYNGQIPHKFESGFALVDVDPWRPDADGVLPHDVPPTFVLPEDSQAADAIDSPLIEQFQSEVPQEAPVESWSFRDEEEETSQWKLEDDADAEQEDREEEDALPELDEEESATFGRLSWQDVRQQVSRTRRPPPSIAV
jgi:hypothetical protein